MSLDAVDPIFRLTIVLNRQMDSDARAVFAVTLATSVMELMTTDSSGDVTLELSWANEKGRWNRFRKP